MQDCMGKLSRADAGSSGKLRMWAVGRQRLALRAVDADFPGVIYCKSSKWASDGTGESQFADRIEKEEYPLARPVTSPESHRPDHSRMVRISPARTPRMAWSTRKLTCVKAIAFSPAVVL